MHKTALSVSLAVLIFLALYFMLTPSTREVKSGQRDASRFGPVAYSSPRQPYASWSGTTLEAAATPAEKAWLQRGRPETIEGELIDFSCYLQLGHRSADHLECATKCLRNGQPAAILTATRQVYLVLPEEHDGRRDGAAKWRELFAAHAGMNVRVSGIVQNTAEGKAIFVSNATMQGVWD